MLRKLQQLRKKEEGFTIIEVLIVLAIAALILVIVLVAIPQLQRNQRNTARKANISRMAQEVGTYVGNNNGSIPTAAADITSITSRYLTNLNLNEPTTGTAMTLTYYAAAAASGVPGATGAVALPAIGTVSYKNGVKCNGERVETGTARQYALWAQQEGGAIICIDNQ